MKPIRNAIIILCVIALLCGGLYFVLQYNPEENIEELPVEEAITVLETNRDNIETIVVTSNDGMYKLVKENGAWVCSGNSALPLSQARVNSLLYECSFLTAQELIAENVSDLAPYGLDAPERVVQIQEKGGKVTSIFVGKTTIEGSFCYITVNDKTKIYTKSASGCENLAVSLSNLLDVTLYETEAESINYISMRQNNGETVILSKKNDIWQMTAPIVKEGNEHTLSEEFLPGIAAVSAAKVIANPAADKVYGFTNPRATYTIKTDQGESYTVTVGKADGALTYVKLAGKPCVYQVMTDSLGFLSKTYLDLANKLIHVENLKETSQITITGLKQDYKITTVGYSDTGSYTVNGKGVNADKFIKVYQSIIGLSVDGYTHAGSGSNKAVTIRYERKDGAVHTVTCRPFDDRNYVVSVDGKGNFLVRNKQIELMESQLESILP